MVSILEKMEEILVKDRNVFRNSETNKTAGLRMMYDEISKYIDENRIYWSNMSVAVYNTSTGNYKIIYENINNLEHAHILAQLAMGTKADNELIIILPGWNVSIKTRHPEEHQYALKIAEKYKVEVTK